MPSPTRVTQSLCAALLAAAVLAGCGGAEKDSAGSGSASGTKPAAGGASSSASDSERDYYGCLKENGVKIETTPDGELRVVKDGGNETALTKAEGKCANLLPAQDTAEDKGGTAKADPAFVACMKAEGFTTYDRSKNGDNDALAAALKKCSPVGKDDKDITVGG
ncbi:hypothetical protein [Streptomyces sp. RKAG290]|uniref:hypothetical protein n=1 Tax=Streptomyces sp. RKAG290 TaxID=2888348 RepID=UPI0020339E91|nr:hypothetical protein [Streptomyces sp. RKAG290]MCM2412778.1 hypothetical protein [Streptomyces sp. RKAG290]